LSDVAGTETFASFAISLNPGLNNAFPWLSGVAPSFEKYRVHSLSIDYVHSTGLETNGRIYLAYNYNPAQTDPNFFESSRQFMQYENSIGFAANQDASLAINPRNIQKGGYAGDLMIRQGPLSGTSATEDERWYDMAVLYLGLSTDDVPTLGTLYVRYDIELKNPTPTRIPNASNVRVANDDGTVPLITETIVQPFFSSYLTEYSASSPVEYSSLGNEDSGYNNTMTFISDYRGQLTMRLNGTGFTADPTQDSQVFTYEFTSLSGRGSLAYVSSEGTTTDQLAIFMVNAIGGDYLVFAPTIPAVNYFYILLTAINSDFKTPQLPPSLPRKNLQLAAFVHQAKYKKQHDDRFHHMADRAIQEEKEEQVYEELRLPPVNRLLRRGITQSHTAPARSVSPHFDQTGIDRRIKGGNTDEHALLYLLFALWFYVSSSQIFLPTPRPTFRPSTRRPTTLPTVRPTTTPAPTTVFYRSSIINTGGTNSAPLGTIVDKVLSPSKRMFAKINSTTFTLNHDGFVLATALWQSLSGTLGIPAYKFYTPYQAHLYDNYVSVTTCDSATQQVVQILNMTGSNKYVTMVKDAATMGGTGIYSIYSFTPLDGFMWLTGTSYTSQCVSGCSVVNAREHVSPVVLF
jgi:hypothetical protein